ncbi:ArsR/SmtB family transcription factor [Flavobacterium silvaticum]|uniref:Winged helix-turn-helix transcriptional regulator n=1 Tax=Flavobacterium silvaticum TaxID=1852020 RepID=A0A972FL98_9FLAO|nr:metalloregulator ArsR/SmtB family transcription factor [Flavobacterium silvaticum]NMH28119.1 winged helix-turn-helix transcriptional regulator [Flavobacterium silvaticum]
MRRDVFQAIADPTRRHILSVLAKAPMNLNAVADHFKISRPAISKQVKILAECGLIRMRHEGRERICEPDFKKIKEVADWAETYSVFWNEKLDALGDFLNTK